MHLFEEAKVVSAFVPVDMQAAQDGDWVSLKGYRYCDVIIFKAAGTAGDDPAITFQQATAVAGTSAKALTKIERVYKQQGTLTSSDTQTTVTQAAAAGYTGDGTSAEEQAIYGFHIDASQLDVTNGFDCIRVRVADTGTNAQLGCGLYVLSGERYRGLSAIVD
jgi:hypothetical protein